MSPLNLERFTSELMRYIRTDSLPTRSGFARLHPYDYRLALRDSRAILLLNDTLPIRTPRWSERTLRQAIKDNNLLTRTQLARYSSSAYNFTRTIPGLLDELYPQRGIPKPRPRLAYRPTTQVPAQGLSEPPTQVPAQGLSEPATQAKPLPCPAVYDWM
jgi:hypothetical protein